MTHFSSLSIEYASTFARLRAFRACRKAKDGCLVGGGRLHRSWLLASWVILVFASLGIAAGEPRRVLLLHSFEREFGPLGSFTVNFRSELARQSPEAVNFVEVSLQPARSTESPEEGPIVDYLRSTVDGHQLDLVASIGGPAAAFAEKHRQELFPAAPLLVAARDERFAQNAVLNPNETAVAVRNDPSKVIDSILQLLPETRNVFVVIGNSSLEQFWRNDYDREFQRFKDRMTFTWFNEISFQEMLERCADLPAHSAIFFPLLSVDAKGIPLVEERALAELHAVANAPIFGLQSTQLGRGVVGGPLMSIEDLSRNTASVASRILQGESAGNIRIPPQQPGPPMFDWRELRRWDIPEERLPPGSIVRFREPTVWGRYKWQIIAGVSLCLVELLLILGLLANLVRRRRAERLLRESKNRLGAILGTVAEGILTTDDNGIIESVNAAAERIFGYTAEEIVGRNLKLLMPTALADDEPEFSQKITGIQRETIGRRKDGTVFPMELSISDVVLEDRRRFTGLVRDITDRKQAEQMSREFGRRLGQAHEEERARLARELHDDITQRLAMVAINAGRAESVQDRLEQSILIGEVRDALMSLSEDVHSLAYKLHPSLLEHLGLAGALKAEYERFSRQESISVAMDLEEVSDAIPKDARLCLLRVTQEALHNVSRHAQAKTADVTLRLMDGAVHLTVRDSGIGFDPSQELQRPSLGLASMQERVRLLGGKLEIESRHGNGTSITAWIPLDELAREGSVTTNSDKSLFSERTNYGSSTSRSAC